MNTQPEALRLADLIDKVPYRGTHEAAAELRRLHALNQEWERKAATWLASPEAAQRLDGLQALNAELLEALKLAHCLLSGANMNRAVVERKVRAAFHKAEAA
jgi:hypothetical protein